MAGRTRCFQPSTVRKPVVHAPSATTSPRPKLGNTFSMTANTKISRMPIRKVGKETPSSEKVIKTCDRKLPRLKAA